MTFASLPCVRTAFLCATTVLSLSASAQSTNTANTVLVRTDASKPVAAADAPPERSKSASEQDAANAKKWSIYWGWNRSNYSESDIHFKGSDHDFTIKNVTATDIQTDATLSNVFAIFLRPSEVTIPQTNLRLGYQYSPDIAIALNLDHMKYVMAADQTVPIVGNINGTAYPAGSTRTLDVNFLNYEHTDGLNIVSLEVEKQRPLNWFGPSVAMKGFVLAGAGIVFPKSNVTLNMLNRARNDEFHVAGYSVGVGTGLELDVYKDVFFRTAYKYGYVNLPDVVTSSQGDRASQHFTYNEWLIALGIRF